MTESPLTGQQYAKPIPGYRVPLRSENLSALRPSTTELAAIGRPGTVRSSTRAGSKAHLAELTEPQLRVLRAADNPAGSVSQNGSTGVTRPIIRALKAKGYGEAIFDAQRRHLIVGFRINERGRRAARERFGVPGWATVPDSIVITVNQASLDPAVTRLAARQDRADLVYPFTD